MKTSHTYEKTCNFIFCITLSLGTNLWEGKIIQNLLAMHFVHEKLSIILFNFLLLIKFIHILFKLVETATFYLQLKFDSLCQSNM